MLIAPAALRYVVTSSAFALIAALRSLVLSTLPALAPAIFAALRGLIPAIAALVLSPALLRPTALASFTTATALTLPAATLQRTPFPLLSFSVLGHDGPLSELIVRRSRTPRLSGADLRPPPRLEEKEQPSGGNTCEETCATVLKRLSD